MADNADKCLSTTKNTFIECVHNFILPQLDVNRPIVEAVTGLNITFDNKITEMKTRTNLLVSDKPFVNVGWFRQNR